MVAFIVVVVSLDILKRLSVRNPVTQSIRPLLSHNTVWSCFSNRLSLRSVRKSLTSLEPYIPNGTNLSTVLTVLMVRGHSVLAASA